MWEATVGATTFITVGNIWKKVAHNLRYVAQNQIYTKASQTH